MNSTYAASKLCRACLSDHEDMQDIFQTCFVEVFEYCTSLQVSVNDGLPSALCKNCVSLLNTSYYFKQQCIRSDETLKQIIIAPQVNDCIKCDTSPDLKYDLSIQLPVATVFPLCDEYTAPVRVNGVDALPDTILDNFDQHLLEDKEVASIEESVNVEEVQCNNYNGDDMKCNYTQEDLKCDGYSEIYSNNTSHIQEKQDIEPIGDKSQLATAPSLTQGSLLAKKVKTKSNKGTIKCPKCEKIFKTSHRLDAHVREHYGLKPFVCKLCQKEFSNWRTLKMHTNKHNGQRNYVCDVCKKAFTYPTALETHKKIHLGLKKHSCAKCDASFSQFVHLKSHMTTHTSEQPYSCTQCQKSFKTNANLKSHLERHKGLKNYVCSVCGKRFPTNGELTTHHRCHSNEKEYKCGQCKKAYKCKSLLTSHTRTHTGDLPFKCAVCCKEFKDSQVLKRHQITHSDLKSHMCPLCHKYFHHKSSLNKHAKSHKKELQGVCFEFIHETTVTETCW